jgi:hypothetical protein
MDFLLCTSTKQNTHEVDAAYAMRIELWIFGEFEMRKTET